MTKLQWAVLSLDRGAPYVFTGGMGQSCYWRAQDAVKRLRKLGVRCYIDAIP